MLRPLPEYFVGLVGFRPVSDEISSDPDRTVVSTDVIGTNGGSSGSADSG